MSRLNFQKNNNQVARSNTIRDINRQIILNYVREQKIISRAEIAKLTDLQRSTVSIIVDDLINEGFLEEIGSGASTGGRKPTMLQLQKGKPAVIGIDITPTFTNIALVDLAGNYLEKESFLTNPNINETFANIISIVKKITGKYENSPLLEAGISVPGLVDEFHKSVIYVPFFQWENWNLGENFFVETGINAVIDNDANSVALAEMWFGRPEINNMKNFMTVLVAEGIGTGIVFDRKVYRGENGVAGEFGHMIIGVDSGVECSCGSMKCWESFASDRATIARYKKLSNENSVREMQEIMDLYDQGNQSAVEAINETLKYLSIGVSNLLVGLSPEAIIISGKISELSSSMAQELLILFERSVRQNTPPLNILASSLGRNPTLIGAISLGLVKKFSASI
jgi:predicted NBD/HSP70 family sugar kinase